MTAPCIIDAGTDVELFATAGDWTQDGQMYAPAASALSLTEGKASLLLQLHANTTVISGYAVKTIDLDMETLIATGTVVLDVFAYANFSKSATLGANMRVYLAFSSTADFSKSFSNGSVWTLHYGWNRIVIGLADWTNTGGEDWANQMIRLKVGLTPSNYGEMGAVIFDRLRAGVQNHSSILLRFDDSFESHYSVAFAKLLTLGLPATVDLVSDYVDNPPYSALTVANVQAMFAAGWAFTLYSHTHIFPTKVTDLALRNDILAQGAWLVDKGITPCLDWGYSHSVVDNRVTAVLKDLGLVVGSLGSSRGYCGVPLVEPLASPAILWGGANITTLAQAKTMVDANIAKGTSLVLYFHDPGSAGDISVSDFNDLMDYISGKVVAGDTVVLTPQDWYAFNTGNPAYTWGATWTTPAEAKLQRLDVDAIVAGDTTPIVETLTYNGLPINLGGCTVEWAVSAVRGGDALVTKTATVTDPEAGVISVARGATDFDACVGSNPFQHREIQVTDISGNIMTRFYGRIPIYGQTIVPAAP